MARKERVYFVVVDRSDVFGSWTGVGKSYLSRKDYAAWTTNKAERARFFSEKEAQKTIKAFDLDPLYFVPTKVTVVTRKPLPKGPFVPTPQRLGVSVRELERFYSSLEKLKDIHLPKLISNATLDLSGFVKDGESLGFRKTPTGEALAEQKAYRQVQALLDMFHASPRLYNK